MTFLSKNVWVKGITGWLVARNGARTSLVTAHVTPLVHSHGTSVLPSETVPMVIGTVFRRNFPRRVIVTTLALAVLGLTWLELSGKTVVRFAVVWAPCSCSIDSLLSGPQPPSFIPFESCTPRFEECLDNVGHIVSVVPSVLLISLFVSWGAWKIREHLASRRQLLKYSVDDERVRR